MLRLVPIKNLDFVLIWRRTSRLRPALGRALKLPRCGFVRFVWWIDGICVFEGFCLVFVLRSPFWFAIVLQAFSCTYRGMTASSWRCSAIILTLVHAKFIWYIRPECSRPSWAGWLAIFAHHLSSIVVCLPWVRASIYRKSKLNLW